MLISLLIATQGLLPDPTPQLIGVQGLLEPGVIPPEPPPIVSGRDLPGGFARDRKRVVIEITRGVNAQLTAGSVSVSISASANAGGVTLSSGSADSLVSTCELFFLNGNVQNISANRVRPTISCSFEVVCSHDDDEAQLLAMAQAALEKMILQEMIDEYSD